MTGARATIKDIAEALALTERGARKRAQTEEWPFEEEVLPTGAKRRLYPVHSLPLSVMVVLEARRHRQAAQPAGEAADRVAAKRSLGAAEAWAHFERLPDAKKAAARAWLETIEAVHALVRGGTQKDLAVRLVCQPRGIGASTYYRRESCTHGIPRADWLPHLVDRRTGRTATVACSPEAWEMLKGDYLRPERPSFEACYRRVRQAAQAHGWTVPSDRTLRRRLEREIGEPVRVLARHGVEALKRMYPAQQRDRSVFHALEAVNADGHRWDVWVRWPDGEIARPCMTAIQDLHSGMMLSWRIDRSENWGAFRLAWADLVESYGIPDHAYLDNGRNFAAKWMTGGIANRFRFKVRDEEPLGILTQLGVAVHWTTPYSGQSKPIERAFRDFCDAIARHPALAGAWTGNSPVNKPENYRSKAIDLETFAAVVAEGIAEHNARPGRRAATCQGRSFAATFEASYAQAPIRKATEEQRRLWLLAAEGVTASRRDGTIKLMGNRFWADFLTLVAGQSLVVRFDPEALADGVHVYRGNGAYLGYAACIAATGFNDVAAAREHGRARRQWLKAQKQMLDAERKMGAAEVAALLPTIEPPAPPVADVIALARPALDLRPRLEVAPTRPVETARHEALIAEFKKPPAPPVPDTATARFDRALRAERQIAAGEAVPEAERAWLERYRDTPEYRSRRRMADEFQGFGGAETA